MKNDGFEAACNLRSVKAHACPEPKTPDNDPQMTVHVACRAPLARLTFATRLSFPLARSVRLLLNAAVPCFQRMPAPLHISDGPLPDRLPESWGFPKSATLTVVDHPNKLTVRNSSR